MLWLSLMLLGLPLEGTTSPRPADDLTAEDSAVRRVMIPTWELVVPVLKDSTPILEQNGPDSVVLMSEISSSPRWTARVSVMQLNAQDFASATQSYLESVSTSEKNVGHVFEVDSDRSIETGLGVARAVWALSARPTHQLPELRDAMIGLIFVPYGDGACIVGEFQIAAELSTTKQVECEQLMGKCTGPTPEKLAKQRTNQLAAGGHVLEKAKGALPTFAHAPRWYRHRRMSKGGSMQELGVTVTWATHGPPPTSLEPQTSSTGLHVHQQTLTSIGTRDQYSEHFDGWVQDDLGLETFGLQWTRGESVWKTDGAASGLFERTPTNVEYILSAGDLKTAAKHNRMFSGLPDATLPMSLRMLTGQLFHHAKVQEGQIRWYAPILSADDAALPARRDQIERDGAEMRVTWTPRQGEPATVDHFDANGVLKRRIFPDGSEMVLTKYTTLVQSWRLAGLPTELLQEGQALYAKP